MIYQITKPCSENWDKMTPVEGGRFCNHCSKKVHDLTNGAILPDTGESFCGRINASSTKQISFKKYLFRQSPVRFFALMFVLLFSNKIKAQLNKIETDSLSFTKESDYEKDNIISISGKLVNEKSKQEVSFGFVTLYDSQKNVLEVTQTGLKGEFSFLVLQRNVADSLFSLKAEYIGLETLELNSIPITRKNITVQVTMDQRESYLGMAGTVMRVIKDDSRVMSSGYVSHAAYRNLPNKDIREIANALFNGSLGR
ncbi:MAG TPA: carboxypeptidase-like regulatory domain-containing protein [Bacteroidia bacterium]|jgi:hypothetical protein|nr:carboxypeptidase-like regulatory domain-containing protein [Bacteroidia bacterium]